MKIGIPSKKVCEGFHLTYELKGTQKAVDVLANYYEIRRMKVILNGKKVGNGYQACYNKNIAYFTKRGLDRFNILHEFYHHLVHRNGLEMGESVEENKANRFARVIMRS